MAIGPGVSGIYLAHKLKSSFTDFTLSIFETSADVGGA